MRKRVYTINVNVKEGKEKVDEIKQAAKDQGFSASQYLIYAHTCLALKKSLESKPRHATADPGTPSEGMESL